MSNIGDWFSYYLYIYVLMYVVLTWPKVLIFSPKLTEWKHKINRRK